MAEALLEPNQTYNTELFAKIVNGLTILAKKFNLDV